MLGELHSCLCKVLITNPKGKEYSETLNAILECKEISTVARESRAACVYALSTLRASRNVCSVLIAIVIWNISCLRQQHNCRNLGTEEKYLFVHQASWCCSTSSSNSVSVKSPTATFTNSLFINACECWNISAVHLQGLKPFLHNKRNK